MRDLLTLTIHLLVTCIKLLRPGGVRAVAAEWYCQLNSGYARMRE